MDELMIWGLIAIGIGIITGVLMFVRHEIRPPHTDIGSPELGKVAINSASIPVRGGIGAAVLIVILLTGVLIALPELRFIALLGMLAGVAFGSALAWWHRHHVNRDAPTTLDLTMPPSIQSTSGTR
jgi:hypothetical protein